MKEAFFSRATGKAWGIYFSCWNCNRFLFDINGWNNGKLIGITLLIILILI
jgi:hypothetical protein